MATAKQILGFNPMDPDFGWCPEKETHAEWQERLDASMKGHEQAVSRQLAEQQRWAISLFDDPAGVDLFYLCLEVASPDFNGAWVGQFVRSPSGIYAAPTNPSRWRLYGDQKIRSSIKNRIDDPRMALAIADIMAATHAGESFQPLESMAASVSADAMGIIASLMVLRIALW